MGQQQLLLLALSSIIVGLAIVVGLNMFSESAADANLNTVTNEVYTIAARAQSWARKPVLMGGGGGSFTGISLAKMAIDSVTPSGSYTFQNNAGSSVEIKGTGVEDLNNDGNLLTVTVKVTLDTVFTPTITR